MTDDFFRARLEQMIDLKHPLAVLANRLPWTQLEAALAPAFARKHRDGKPIEGSDLFGPTLAIASAGVSAAGRPRLSIRLMASLLYLKHAFNLSDEELVERWAENVVWQYFSGQTYYEPRLPCDATQVGRFRTAIGEAGVEELLKATIDTAVATQAVRPAEFERIIVDSTVQEKAIAHPVDSRLLEIARAKLVQAAKFAGISLKQTFVKEGRELRRKAGGYAHARQFKRLRRAVKRQRTILGIVLREIHRKLATATTESPATLARLTILLERAERIRTQQPKDKNKLYALHAPEVESSAKGKPASLTSSASRPALPSPTRAGWSSAREPFRRIRTTDTSWTGNWSRPRFCWRTPARRRSRSLSIWAIVALMKTTPMSRSSIGASSNR
jgi:IS5 family transposase